MLKIKPILFVILLLIIVLALYVFLLFSSKLNIKNVEIYPLGSSSVNSGLVVDTVNLVKGDNLLKLSEKKLISEIEKINVVRKASIEKYYPDTLKVSVNYGDIDLRLKGSSELYFLENGRLKVQDEDVYNFYFEVAEVEVSDDYLKRLQGRIDKNVSTADLDKVVELSGFLQNSGFAKNIKYTDSTSTSSYGFGTLEVLLNNNYSLRINSPISINRLSEVLDEIHSYDYNALGLMFYVDGTKIEQVQNLVNRSY